MHTKQDEFKALDKIIEIVDALGKDSYLSFAFEGCFDVARENIQNDWACSMKQRAEAAEQQVSKLKEQLQELKDHKKLQAAHEQLLRDFDELRSLKFEAEQEAGKANNALLAIREENVKLKAKLYDYMTREGK